MTDRNCIRPVRSERDHADCLARMEALMSMERAPEENDELLVLTTLVEDYEEKHFPIDRPDPISAIKFCMEQSGKTQKDLAPILVTLRRLPKCSAAKEHLRSR